MNFGKRSPIGTMNMARNEEKSVHKVPKSFSATEICRIIKLCKKSDVSELKIGEFEVSFHKKADKTVQKPIESERKLDLPSTPSVTPSTPVAGNVERDFGIQDRQTLAELEASQLLIDDPVSYEEQEIDAAIHNNGPQMVTVNEEERHWRA